MTKKPGIVCALATVLVSGVVPVGAFADTYAWTDESGSKHLTDRLSAVPEKYRDRVVRVGGGSSSAPAAEAAEPKRSAPTAGAPAASGGAGSDEIFRFGAEPVARSATPPAGSPGAETDAQEAPKDNEGHDKAWWQQQMAAALNRQTSAAETVRKLDAGNVILTYGRPADRTKHRNELAKARAEAEEADKALEALKKRARTAEADPAWLVLPGMETSEEKKKP